jgi:ATP-dependent DNA helicase DinG
VDTDNRDHDFVRECFGAGGLLARHFPNYEPRVGQVELAYSVDEAMTKGFNTVVEAPTGTGKSIGYGMPAALHAARGENTVIVTANIALQEQLYHKDLPLLAKVLPWKFTYALAKGVGNYLCLDMFDETTNDMILSGFVGNRAEREQWDQVVTWRAKTTTGDLSELPFEPLPSTRFKMTVVAEDCLGSKCAQHGECFSQKARGAAKSAQVVVTNYALFFADLVMKRSGANGVLPKYTHVVFDEGHQAAELARGFLGFRVTRGGIAMATKLLDHKQGATSKRGPLPVINEQLRKRVIAAGDVLFASLTKHYHSSEYSIRFQRKWDADMHGQAKALCGLLEQAGKELREAAVLPGITGERAHELHAMAGRCAKTAVNIMQVADMSDDEWIYFMEEENDRIALKGNPISVAEYLRENLFEYKQADAPVKSVTVTSATLATTVDDFEFIGEQLGIRDAERLSVLSPFDIAANTLLVCPPMPSPQHDRFIASVAERVLDVLDEVGGRTLCLFTSHRVMNAVYEMVRRETKFPLMKQGEAPRTQLIDRFKRDIESVLFGTESFWAGVDVPGESLSCVIIDKLPFPNISDPLQDVLKARHGKDYFNKVSVPHALLEFRQGAGRLIRTMNDRGVIVVLDSRITEKGYGKQFVRVFPSGTSVVRDLGAIRPFLDRRAHTA